MKTKLITVTLFILALVLSATSSFAQAKKPNILVIWGDESSSPRNEEGKK